MYKIIPLTMIKKSPRMRIDILNLSDLSSINYLERIIFKPNVNNPLSKENIKRPWLLNIHKENNFMILKGSKYIDLYDPKLKIKHQFILTNDKLYKNNILYCEYPCILSIYQNIFYRYMSGLDGFEGINLAKCESNTINNNIYDINTNTGHFKLLNTFNLNYENKKNQTLLQ
jgi:hypothetical protein